MQECPPRPSDAETSVFDSVWVRDKHEREAGAVAADVLGW
jgi:hypothetical protein